MISSSDGSTLAPATPQTPTTVPALGRLHALVAMTRPSQIALILLILANGVLLGTSRVTAVTLDPLAVLLGVALVIAAAVAVHLANESADHETDLLAERTPFSGGSGALAASALRPEVPLAMGLALAVTVVAGTIAGLATGLLPSPAAALMLGGLAGGLAYSLPPIAAMRHGWGEPLNALLGGLLLPLFGVALVAGGVNLLDVAAFLPFGLVVMASVLATAWPDRDVDAATGKLTMSVRLDAPTLRRIHLVASVGFVAATVLSAASGAMPLALSGLLVVPALLVGLRSYTRVRSPLPNVAAMVGLGLITTLALVAAAVVPESA